MSFLSFAALGWLGREIYLAAPPIASSVRTHKPGSSEQLRSVYDAGTGTPAVSAAEGSSSPARDGRREKRAMTADVLPPAQDRMALLRLFLLLNLARKH